MSERGTRGTHATLPAEAIDLDVSGMTCASCAAGIERTLGSLDGVADASVNFATSKAHVELADPAVSAADVVKAIESIGYGASVRTRPGAHGGAEHDHAGHDHDHDHDYDVADVRRRAIVAVVAGVPVLLMSMISALQFDGWQWVALALTTPVATWAAWPFHRATWTNLRHGAATMDTLISMGVGAAYLWSLYALFFGMAGMPGLTHGFEWVARPGDAADTIYLEVAAGVTMFVLLGRYIELRS